MFTGAPVRALIAHLTLTIASAFFWLASPAAAQDGPYAPGWDLDPAASSINFGSIKNEKGQQIIETHSFANFSSAIEPDGKVTIRVKLDSVDTKNDLRNVRMRFLFFETFKYPEAEVTAQLAPDMAAGLAVGGAKTVQIPFAFNLHGVTNQMVTTATVTAESNDRISVAAAEPVIFRVVDFGLDGSLKKIAETAGGFDIVPEMTIAYQFAFTRRAAGEMSSVVADATIGETGAAAALETQGEFSTEECVGRFDILSETGNIYFDSGSASLKPDSAFVLASITDIIKRCPGLRILVSGHTDDVGSNEMNQGLSERRARSVVDYLAGQGIEPGRLFSAGFGEDHPMVVNDSDFNRSRNRRIEFSLYR
ncbi:MAG: OmpA family protein [Paracoccaceae bacterium]